MAGILALYPNVKNPYRELTLLVGVSPVLAHALSAIGALHYALLANGDFAFVPCAADDTGIIDTLHSLTDMEGSMTRLVSQGPAPKTYEHYLLFKQHALRQLSLDIGDPVMRNDDRTLAAIIALALLDAVESGSGAWKYHLEGAKNLLKGRQQIAGYGGCGNTRGMVIEGLDRFVLEGCLLFEIMGSTLARPGTLSKPFDISTMGSAILTGLERTSFVGCPAYLLGVIFFVHAQWYSESEHTHSTTTLSTPSYLPGSSKLITTPSALIHHIQSFNPTTWAQEMQTFHSLPDLTARIALAASYKAAVYLYAVRVLSRPRLSPSSNATTAAITNELIHQLSSIPRTDPHFKCLIWPTFIAGAESWNRAQRATILDLLNAIYHVIMSVNVRNAAWVLSVMWRKQARRRWERGKVKVCRRSGGVNVDGGLFGFCGYGGGGGADDVCDDDALHDCDDDDDDDFDWVQELGNSRVDWLFI